MPTGPWDAGFGNRVIGALSGLLLAIATKRVFLITDSILTGMMRENGIMWRYEGRVQREDYHLSIPLNVDEEVGCEDLGERWKAHEIITLESTQYFLPLISHNPHFRAWFRQHLGSDLKHLASTLLAFLFLPNKELETAVLTFARQHGFKRRVFAEYNRDGWEGKTWVRESGLEDEEREKVIGLQVRREHLYEADRESAYFFQCATSISSSAPFKVFIASDQLTQTYSIAQRHLPPFTQILQYAGPHASMVDLYLLSLADELIITWPRSTFGSIAVALRGDAPYSVHSSMGLRGVCVRQLSAEPCYHGWYRRRALKCWSEEWETAEMLNMDNCYQCKAHHGCAEGLDVPSDEACDRQTCPAKVG